MLKFRAFNSDDFEKYTNGAVTNATLDRKVRTAKDLYSAVIFGQDSEEVTDGSKTMYRGYRRGRIELPVPILNYTITGAPTSANLLCRVLGIEGKRFESIMRFQSVYSLETRDFVRFNDESENDYKGYLVHTQVLERLIDDFDQELEIRKELKKKLKNVISHAEPEDFDTTGDYHIFGGYYFNGELNAAQQTRLENFLKSDFISSGNERIVYLLNLDSKEIGRASCRERV